MKIALILLALAAVVAADSYGHGGYGGYKTDYYHPAHYKFDWAVKDDYYYNDYGQYESRYGYETKGHLGTGYSGYDNKPAGHQKIEYVIYSEPIQVQSYGGYGHGGYNNKGYTKGYDTNEYKSSY